MATTDFTPHVTRRSRLAVVRDLVVVGLCALLVAGFIVDVTRGARGSRQPAAAQLGS